MAIILLKSPFSDGSGIEFVTQPKVVGIYSGKIGRVPLLPSFLFTLRNEWDDRTHEGT